MADIFKQGQKTTIIAISTTIVFALMKAIVGFISGSVVLLGDAVHSFADSFSSFAAWFGLKIAKKEHCFFNFPFNSIRGLQYYKGKCK